MSRENRLRLVLTQQPLAQLVPLVLVLLLGALGGPLGASSIVVNETVGMVCFPPNAGQLPPCPVPVGIDPALVAPNPVGTLRILTTSNNKAAISIRLSGMSPDMVVTAWFVHFPAGQPTPDPIFDPIGPGQPPIAMMNSPVAHSRASFTEGRGREPNGFRIHHNGRAHLLAWLDYNPLATGQVPLVNGMTPTQQTLAPAGSGAEQPTCCPDHPAGPRIAPVGGSWLRRFDPVTGYQMLEASGYPELLRSPSRPPVIALVVHTDSTTFGVLPGIAIPPFLINPPVTAGNYYLLGLFPLGPLGAP